MLTKFYCRPAPKDTVKIYVRLRPSASTEIKTSVPCKPFPLEIWNAYTGGSPTMSDKVRDRIRKENANLFARFDAVKAAVDSAATDNKQITLEDVKTIIDDAFFREDREKLKAERAERLAKRDTFSRYFADVITKLEEDEVESENAKRENREPALRIKAARATRTRMNYKYTFDLLEGFRKDIPFSSLDNKLLEDFRLHLARAGKGAGTIAQVLGILKTVARWAYSDGKMKNPLIASGKETRADQGRNEIALTVDELDRIAALDLSEYPANYDLARDYLLIGCLTGQRYSDIRRISSEQFYTDEAGTLCLSFVQQKTGAAVSVVVASRLVPIFEKYGLLDNAGTVKTIPAISEPWANACLKTVGKLARMDAIEYGKTARASKEFPHGHENPERWELLSTHCGRRTCATLLLKEGASTVEIQSVTGHKSVKNVERYLKLTLQDKVNQQKRFTLFG